MAAVVAVVMVIQKKSPSSDGRIIAAAVVGAVKGVTVRRVAARLALVVVLVVVQMVRMAAHITPQALTQQTKVKVLYTAQAAQQGLMALQVHQALQVQMATLSTALQTSHS